MERKGTFISSVSGSSEEYYLSNSSWSGNVSDWKQRFEVGEVVADPSGSWEPSTAEQYIDQQIGIEASTRLAQDTYIQSQIPLADEEDITKSGSYLKFKDRTYNQISPDGMGCIYLRKEDNFKTVIESVTQGNTIFVIRYDYTLTDNVTVPANCILDFQGGSLSGAYTITGANTGINARLVKVFNTNVTLAGSWNIDVSYPEWFDVSDAAKTRNAIQKAVNIADHIVFNGDYNVQNSVYNPNEDIYAQRQLIIAGTVTEDYITVGSGKTIEITGKVKATSPLTDLFRVEGDCTVFCGGGIIEGCGIVNDTNSSDSALQWNATLININGHSNCIDNLRIYSPTTSSIMISASSENTSIKNCIFGGGLTEHGTGTTLMAISNRGLYTVVENNRFVPYNSKNVYTVLWSAYQNDGTKRQYIFKNNYVEGVLEHAVYSYGLTGGIIEGNQIKDCVAIPLQLFCEKNIIKNNIIEWTLGSSAYDPELNPNGLVAISTRKGGHLIEGNTFKNITARAIQIGDSTTATSVEGDAENIYIINNNIIIDYGPGYNFTGGIKMDSPYNGVARNIHIKGNNFIGVNTIPATCYVGVIEMATARNDNEPEFENINIEDNNFINLFSQPLRALASTKPDGYYGFKNITITNNNVKHCTTSSWIAYMGPAIFVVDRCNGCIIKGNNIENIDSDTRYTTEFINNIRSINTIISNNKCITSSSLSTYIHPNENVHIVKDNIFNYPQNGLATLTSSDTYTEGGVTYVGKRVNAPIAYYGDRSDKGVTLIPVNAAAVALQKTANAAYVEYPPSIYPLTDEKYGSFKIRVSEAVTEDCIFAWEVVY